MAKCQLLSIISIFILNLVMDLCLYMLIKQAKFHVDMILFTTQSKTSTLLFLIDF